jgi:hypothetical protein
VLISVSGRTFKKLPLQSRYSALSKTLSNVTGQSHFYKYILEPVSSMNQNRQSSRALTSEAATKSGQIFIKLPDVSKNMKIQLVKEKWLGLMKFTFEKPLLKKSVFIK